MVEMNGWEMSLSWSKRGIWGRRGVGGGGWGSQLSRNIKSWLPRRPLVPRSPLVPCPLVLLPSCAPSTTQPLHHNFQPVRRHLFEASEHLNIEKRHSSFLKSSPFSKRDEMFSIVSYPFEFVIIKTLWWVGYEWLFAMRWDEASKEMFSIDSWEASGGSVTTCVYCNHRAFALGTNMNWMMEGMFAYLLILASCYSLFIWLDVSHKLTSKANIFWKRVWLFGEGLYIRWVIGPCRMWRWCWRGWWGGKVGGSTVMMMTMMLMMTAE